jgi:hypothetical protein
MGRSTTPTQSSMGLATKQAEIPDLCARHLIALLSLMRRRRCRAVPSRRHADAQLLPQCNARPALSSMLHCTRQCRPCISQLYPAALTRPLHIALSWNSDGSTAYARAALPIAAGA